jgi:hypothetical protein
MIRRTTRPTSNFYCLNNAIVSDKELSWAARGLLVFLLTKPDNWRISPAHLVGETKSAIGKQSGRDHVYALLNELICAGYIAREQIRDVSGKIDDVDYIVNEVKAKDGVVVDAQASITAQTKPMKAIKATKNNTNQVTKDTKLLTDSPDTEKPDTAFPTLTKNEIKQERKEELLPTLPEKASANKTVVRSSFYFDPNSLEIESGVMDKTESNAVRAYLARALETPGTAQIVLDEVVGKIRAGKAAGHDKPIRTIVGYTTTIVARLHQGGFLESHALSERTRREKLALIEKSKTESVQKQATPESAEQPKAQTAERSYDEIAKTAIQQIMIQVKLGNHRKALEKALIVKSMANDSALAANWVSASGYFASN